MLKSIAKSLLPQGAIDAYRAWEFRQNLPPKAKAVYLEDKRPGPRRDPGVEACIEAHIAWLCRAQDMSRSQDGGVARDYSLIRGWNASYPETTGYIIPTLIDCAHEYDRPDLLERVRRMLDWFVAIQLPDGGFQGGTIEQAPVVPVTFNTGQILIGLAAGAREFNDARYHEAMHGAARFLRDSLDPDGCWRSHPTPFAEPGDKAYETHVSWGLFEAHRVAPDEGYGEAGLRQTEWACSRQQDNGWFADNCLTHPEAPLTHTIGYALRGVVEAYRLSESPVFLDRAVKTADALLGCIGEDGWIAGQLDADWRPAADYVCLTGSVQIAACWFLLADILGRDDYAGAARLANGFVRRTVKTDGDPDILGGVKGSFPAQGGYGTMEYLNWAAKFSIDAQLMEKRRSR